MSRIAITGLLLNNVKDFGAKGDGVTDDRAAIQSAITDAVNNGRGGIFFPAGTFIVGLAAASQASLILTAVTNFRIAGTGPASVVKMAGVNAGAVNWAMFRLTGACANVYFDNLTLDGNRANVSNTSTATRLIFTESTVTDVDISRVYFKSCRRIGATIDGQRISLHDCEFTDHSEVGLEIRDVVSQALVDGCYFFSNVLLDLQIQPTTAITTSLNIIVTQSFFDKAGAAATILVQGLAAATGPTRCRITDCVILGTVDVVESPSIAFSGNSFQCSAGVPLTVEQIVDRCLIDGNTFQSTGGTPIRVLIGGGNAPTNVHISDNRIVCPSAGVGIQVTGGTNVTICDNDIIAFPSGTSVRAIDCATSGAMGDLLIRDNDCVGTFTGTVILFDAAGAARSYAAIVVTGNRLQGSNVNAMAFSLTAPGVYNRIPVVFGNLIDHANLFSVGAFANFPDPCVISGGAGARATAGGTTNGGTQFTGTGSPEGVVTASRGDMFQRVDGAGGTTFYVKSTGDLTNTGWIALTASPIYLPEQWCQNDVPANTANQALEAQVSTNFATFKAPRAGSIVGLVSRLSEAVTAGTLTVEVTINGAGTGLTVVSTNASNQSGGQSTQAPGTDAYVAGDLIGVRFTTDAGFLPITTDLEAAVQVAESF